MPLTVGDQLGPYEILSPIGAGGMGEVYKARDTRLDRTVAVKVLPEHIAKREDVRLRFEREARAVASLNHPHICILHDIGRHENTGYMVMEFMEGETLGDRLAKGPIPLDQALKHAIQIADALDRAHRAGVTHRDVKPGNIMLTRDGVKVLDFGLAKSAPVRPGSTDSTLTNPLTAEGAIMGTPQYMAPEQFEGKEADARADIWAFGAVLYEMVTGQKAFRGKSYTGLVSAVLTADPAPMPVKPFTPSWLERLVRRCLAKDPEERYQSMRDVVLDLRAPTPEATVAVRPSRWPGAVAAAGVLLAVVAGYLGLRKAGEAAALVRFDVNPPAGAQFNGGGMNTEGLAISPDGRTLAFMATNAKGETLLYVRPLDSLETRALAGTENAGRPFWSPDSKSLGFVGGGKLKRVEVVGGSTVALCDAPAARGGTWNEDGVILFADGNVGLLEIPASGGTPAAVTKTNTAAGEEFHYYPQFLPGGKEFLFLVRSADRAKGGIYLGALPGGALDGRAPVLVQLAEFNGLYDATSRRLLYLQGNGTLMARRLELDPPRLTGDPVMVAEGVAGVGLNGYGEFSISGNGTLFYRREGAARRFRFGWLDRAGTVLEQIGQAVDVGFGHNLSPDGNRVAYGAGRSAGEIWVMGLGNGMMARITFNGGSFPRWSPDGRYLYNANGSGIWRKAADGSGEEESVWKGPAGFLQSLAPDGKHLLFGVRDIMLLALGGEKKAVPYVQTKFRESAGAFSPDGRWVAYHSDESGRPEVYIQGFPERRGKWPVTAEGGYSPNWRADGKELYWRGSDGRTVMAAAVELQAGGVKAGRGEALFRGGGTLFTAPQPSPDGKRFLDLIPEGGAAAGLPMVVVLNWAAGLGK